MTPLQSDVRREVASRQLASEKLLAFCAYVSPWFNPRLKHMQLLAEALEQVELYIRTNGKEGTGRLIIMIQPQVGKTTLVANHFPAWILGRHPNVRTIIASYNAQKAVKCSKAVRDIISSEGYANVFGSASQYAIYELPREVSEDTHAAADWALGAPHRGACIARGVGGGVTGEPAELIIVDDPHKDREETASPTQLHRVIDWWDSQLTPRITNATAVVIIHTRWSPDDLIGTRIKLMAGGDPAADWWKVICIPALPYEPEIYAQNVDEQMEKAKLGLWLDLTDPLGRIPGSEIPVWPDRHSIERLKAARASSEFEWWSIYQQQPRPLSGGFFDRDDFILVDRDQVPEKLNWVRYVDMAISDAITADFNATVAVAHDARTGDLYLRDMIRMRGWDKFRPRLKAAMLDPLERGVEWGLEKAAFQSLAFQELMKDRELVGVAIKEIIPLGNKLTRALPLQYRAKSGHVKLVNGPWVNGFIDEAVLFTGQGRNHDDQIDTASGGMQMIGFAVHRESRIL